MKITNDNPTDHIIIVLTKYSVDSEIEDYHKYGFGYFKMDDLLISKLNLFHDNWEKGIRDFPGIVLNIPEMYLIDSEFIHDEVHGNDNPDYSGIKLDSINFIETFPDINPSLMKSCKSDIIANRSNFLIQCEDLIERGEFSLTIYRSPMISYWKIDHLLRRKKPI